MPPARTVAVPGRGEFFLRDSGGDGQAVMLLHGWMASADLNWHAAYADLSDAGYRVLAIDHRGHGRGLRPLVPFRLSDCAGDAAAVLRELDVAPAIVVGYSMGLVLSVAPRWSWRSGIRRVGLEESPQTAWPLSEMLRHQARDLAEAGRELGRFDSRPWLSAVTAPSAVVLTARDTAVAPHKQRELAAALGASVFEAPITHLQITTRPERYNPVLLEALAAVNAPRHVPVA
jgi:3-oxoadipate enol-lactonase